MENNAFTVTIKIVRSLFYEFPHQHRGSYLRQLMSESGTGKSPLVSVFYVLEGADVTRYIMLRKCDELALFRIHSKRKQPRTQHTARLPNTHNSSIGSSSRSSISPPGNELLRFLISGSDGGKGQTPAIRLEADTTFGDVPNRSKKAGSLGLE